MIQIIQTLVDKENYFYIHDIKELKKVRNSLIAIHSKSSKMRCLKQKLLVNRILILDFAENPKKIVELV